MYECQESRDGHLMYCTFSLKIKSTWYLIKHIIYRVATKFSHLFAFLVRLCILDVKMFTKMKMSVVKVKHCFIHERNSDQWVGLIKWYDHWVEQSNTAPVCDHGHMTSLMSAPVWQQHFHGLQRVSQVPETTLLFTFDIWQNTSSLKV